MWPAQYIDHINGNPADNRIVNLREASPAENTHNKRKSHSNTSGIKGVSWHKRDKKWYAQMEKENKNIFIGAFKTIEEAAAAIKLKRKELHGDFTNHG